MSLSFLMDEMNADFLADLGTRWGVVFDKERYTLINPSVEAIVQQKSISAVLQFFIDLGGHYLQDEADKESRTALNAYTELSQGTGYTFHLVDSFPATTLSYQKNMSKTERFHYYNKRYGVEFIVSGTNVYLYRKIGSHRPEVRIDEDLNVKDATVEIDDANFFTWCKCYYDKIDDTEGGAEEYRHEVVYADQGLIEQYGEIEGPAIYQGSIKDEQVMLDFAKSTQEESLKVSHSVTLADLRRQGYDEFIFRAGDTIRLSLSSINTTVDIRIMEIDETFDVNGELTGLTLTLGNYDPVDAYKNSRDAVLLDLEDWIRGRKQIPSNMLEDAVQRAADIVLGDTDSVMEYRKDRLIGHHSKNAGNNITMNVNGIVLYRNGVPKTALTYEGINLDAVVAGSVLANHIRGGTLASLNDNTEWNLNTGEFRMGNADMTLYGGAKILFTDSFNQILFKNRKSGESFDRVSGFGVGYGTSGYPFAHMGAHPSGVMQTTDILYTGFTAASHTAIEEGGSSSVTGKRFQFRSNTAFDKMITLDYFNDSLTWYGMNNFTVGSEFNPIGEAYVETIKSRRVDIWNPNSESEFGFSFHTAWWNNNTARPGFRARYANAVNHDLGYSTHRWNQLYLKNSPNVSSDERLKKNIVDNTLGLEFVNQLETKKYDLISNEADEKSQLGVIAQQLKPVLESYDSNIALLEEGDDGYYGVKYEQFTPILIKSTQELYAEIKELKTRIRKLEGTAYGTEPGTE